MTNPNPKRTALLAWAGVLSLALVVALATINPAGAEQAKRNSTQYFTPILSGSGAAPDVLTYSRQVGFCSQAFESITCAVDITVGQDYDSTTGAGAVRIQALPFSVYSSASAVLSVPVAGTLITSATSGSLFLDLTAGGTDGTLRIYNNDGVAVDDVDWDWLESGSALRTSFTFPAAQ